MKNESTGISKVSTELGIIVMVFGVPAAVGAAPPSAVAAAAVRAHENRCNAAARFSTRNMYTPPAFWVATCVAVAATRTVGPVGLKTVSIDNLGLRGRVGISLTVRPFIQLALTISATFFGLVRRLFFIRA
jgi:hypothetical protein